MHIPLNRPRCTYHRVIYMPTLHECTNVPLSSARLPTFFQQPQVIAAKTCTKIELEKFCDEKLSWFGGACLGQFKASLRAIYNISQKWIPNQTPNFCWYLQYMSWKNCRPKHHCNIVIFCHFIVPVMELCLGCWELK